LVFRKDRYAGINYPFPNNHYEHGIGNGAAKVEINMINSTMNISTTRLRLRPLKREDAATLREITDADEITDAISFLEKGFSLEGAMGLIEGGEFLGIWNSQVGTLVGALGIHKRTGEEVELGYWVGVAFQGQGYASEALKGVVSFLSERFPAYQVFAECAPENHASKQVLIKSGFQVTGASKSKPGLDRLDLKKT
jgi:RimJ/RimL family protein N-acetyltransferase